MPLNFGYFKSPLALLEPIGTHFSQRILKIQIFLSNFYIFDFSGNRRLLALFGASFRVFFGVQLSALIFFSKHRFARRHEKQQQHATLLAFPCSKSKLDRKSNGHWPFLFFVKIQDQSCSREILKVFGITKQLGEVCFLKN